ncbi:MAG: TlpA family protein disulfide reductase [Gammaproteobacteria bacterium]|nr:TlpA family protein disulfide reductase [Gammaproteobacteria bacterium]MBU1973506.1 TlpA family protein disulfide reductase [Gammaproteobacteria bacterium]
MTLLAAVLPAPTLLAAPVSPPHLDVDGQAGYRAFIEAPRHAAFAIAPGGAYGWVAAQASSDVAEGAALAACQGNTRQKCVLYSVNQHTVFDARAWPALWGPYATAEQARKAPVGRELGQRFPDLEFLAANGETTSVSRLRGKVVILHFWGSWCGPCRREMPDLQKLHERIRRSKDVALVLLQTRERFDVSQRWAGAQGIRLPLFDSGSSGELDDQFHLAGGGSIRDREIAARFPTTYVLDKQGLVVFSHVGPVHGWTQYEAFLRDAAARSGK